MNKEKLREEVLSIIRYAITEEYRSNPGPIDTDAADEIMQLIEKHTEEYPWTCNRCDQIWTTGEHEKGDCPNCEPLSAMDRDYYCECCKVYFSKSEMEPLDNHCPHCWKSLDEDEVNE